MSSPRTVVHLVRHGEVHNPGRLLYGRLPGYRLSPLGEQMATAVADWLAGHDVSYVVASPLERAQQTAQPIADRFGLTVATDSGLIESTNVFEGAQVTSGASVWRRPGTWWSVRNPFRPSWGEPYAVVAARMKAALLAARAAASGHEAVCVSHQLPIWTLRCSLEGRRLWHDPRRRQCALASVTSFHFNGTALTQITYSEPAAHLGPGVGTGA